MLLSLSIFRAPSGCACTRFNATQSQVFPFYAVPFAAFICHFCQFTTSPRPWRAGRGLWLWKSGSAVSPRRWQTFPGAALQSIELTFTKPAPGQIKVAPVQIAARSSKSLTPFSPYCLSWRSGGCEQCLVLLKSYVGWSKKPSREMKSQAGWRQGKIPLGFRPSGIPPLGFQSPVKGW